MLIWKSREQLEQHRLELLVGLVDLVDQQDDGFGRCDRGHERSRQQELLAEDVLLHVLPAGLLGFGLDAEQLLAVVPLVQRLGLVQPLVALEPDEGSVEVGGQRLGELGLADAGGAFDEDRLAELDGQERDERGRLAGQVADVCVRPAARSAAVAGSFADMAAETQNTDTAPATNVFQAVAGRRRGAHSGSWPAPRSPADSTHSARRSGGPMSHIVPPQRRTMRRTRRRGRARVCALIAVKGDSRIVAAGARSPPAAHDRQREQLIACGMRLGGDHASDRTGSALTLVFHGVYSVVLRRAAAARAGAGGAARVRRGARSSATDAPRSCGACARPRRRPSRSRWSRVTARPATGSRPPDPRDRPTRGALHGRAVGELARAGRARGRARWRRRSCPRVIDEGLAASAVQPPSELEAVLARNRPCRGAARLAAILGDEAAMTITRSKRETRVL